MRTILVALFVLGLSACASVDATMPKAASSLEVAKNKLAKADKVYQAVCVPPLEPQLNAACHELAQVLDSSEQALNVAIDAYSAVNAVLEAAKAGAQ